MTSVNVKYRVRSVVALGFELSDDKTVFWGQKHFIYEKEYLFWFKIY